MYVHHFYIAHELHALNSTSLSCLRVEDACETSQAADTSLGWFKIQRRPCLLAKMNTSLFDAPAFPLLGILALHFRL